MKRFHLRQVILLVLAAYVLVDACMMQGPLSRRVVAEMARLDHRPLSIAARAGGGGEIRLRELEEAMRDDLWRRGGAWVDLPEEQRDATRTAAVERLINDRLIRAARMSEAVADRVSAPGAGDELAVFARQFDKEEDFAMRLALRQVTESALKGQMQDALDDEAWLESQLGARTEPVTDKDVNEWLKTNRATVAVPAVYGVAHIYLTAHDAEKPDREAEMRAIHRKLSEKEGTFAQLALVYSEDERTKRTGGELGWCARDRMPADFMNAVQKLEAGETSEPVKTRLGWHILRLIDKRPGRMPPAQEVRSEVVALLRAERRAAALKELMAQLRAQSADSIVMNRALIDAAAPP